MTEPIPPGQMLANNLTALDEQMAKLRTNQPVQVAAVHASSAQVFATAALVAAVRELTDEVRKLGEN